MDLNLERRHALVCGASRGIGLASAIELASLGATVTLVARDGDRLERAMSKLPTPAGQRHACRALDLDDPDAAATAIGADLPFHILINNSGGPPGGPLIEADGEAFLIPFRRHVLASQRLVQTLLPGMREAGYGRVVNIISTSVREPIAGLGVSNTIRGAMASWAKTLSAELGPDRITVNNVLPGFTDTERLDSLIAARARSGGQSEAAVADGMRATVPMKRFADAGEVGAMVAYLCTPAAAYISGQSIAVDGGRLKSI